MEINKINTFIKENLNSRKKIVAFAKEKLKNKKTKQVLVLYSSMIVYTIITFGVSIFNTRLLGPQSFGDYKFIQSILNFFPLIVFFGIFTTGNNIIANADDKEKNREYAGALTVFAFILFIIFVLCLIITSFIIKPMFGYDLGYILLFILPLVFAIPIHFCAESIATGNNHIYALSLMRLSPNIIYLIFGYIFHKTIGYTTLTATITLLSSTFIVYFIYIISLKPIFKNMRSNLNHIWQVNKEYGLHIYSGALANVASSQIGNFAISFFTGNIQLGFYSLAKTVTAPITLIPNVIGLTFFKSFTKMDKIPKKVTIVTMSLSAIAVIVFLIMLKPIILIFYKKEFLATIPFAVYVCFASIFQGYGDYINKFLQAHGKGKEIRNSAVYSGFINIVFYIVLVKYFGAIGAAWTYLASSLVYLGSLIYYYRRFVNNTSLSKP